jgi:hypothetical protein
VEVRALSDMSTLTFSQNDDHVLPLRPCFYVREEDATGKHSQRQVEGSVRRGKPQ